MIDEPGFENPLAGFPRVQHIEDKHLLWLMENKKRLNILKVSSKYLVFNI
jgi:hypothetical protein